MIAETRSLTWIRYVNFYSIVELTQPHPVVRNHSIELKFDETICEEMKESEIN